MSWRTNAKPLSKMSIWLSIQNFATLRGAFDSTENGLVGFSYTLEWRMKQHFPKIRKRAQPFETFSPRVSVPFEFAPEISRVFRWIVRLGYSVNFPKQCSQHLPPFQTFIWNFWSNRKRPSLNVSIQVPKQVLNIEYFTLAASTDWIWSGRSSENRE